MNKPKFTIGQKVRVTLRQAEGIITHWRLIADGFAYRLQGEDIYPKAWYREDWLENIPIREFYGQTGRNNWKVAVWQRSNNQKFSYSLAMNGGVLVGDSPEGANLYLSGCFGSPDAALQAGIRRAREIARARK